VATPIGNLEDVTLRSLKVLQEADFIVAEDTRHSRKLLDRFGITNTLVSYHHHNQKKMAPKILKKLVAGVQVELICDAGTPGISDPGELLFASAHEHGVQVVPIPAASALTCALSVCGFTFGEVLFVGFLPPKKGKRQNKLKGLSSAKCCLVFYEAPHRVVESLTDMNAHFGSDCPAFIAREMTKLHETFRRGSLFELAEWLAEEPEQIKGEFVIVVDNSNTSNDSLIADIDHTLEVLLKELPPSRSAHLAAEILGVPRSFLYKRALKMNSTGR